MAFYSVTFFECVPRFTKRNLHPVTFPPLVSVPSKPFPLFNEAIHSNRLVIWAVVQPGFIYLWFPSGTELPSEGHLTQGEGALTETGWRSPAESDLIVKHTSSIIPLFLLFFSFCCLSLFLILLL